MSACTVYSSSSFLAFSRVHTGSAAWLCLPHLARFVTSSGARPSALMSSVTESIHRFLGLPRGWQPPGSRRSAVLATESMSLRMVWLYHLRRASLIFSVIAATLSRRLMSSFIIWSWRVSPSIHRSIFITIAWRADSCFLVVGQHSAL